MSGFHDYVTNTLFHGTLPAWQRNPLDAMIAEGDRLERDVREGAYVLATAYHETARFKYNEEVGQGRGHKYGEDIWRYSNKQVAYFGRGWPQHTWLGNYARLSVRATLAHGREMDFVNNPDMINSDDKIQAWAMWECMISGLWTGVNFADCKDDAGVLDYVKARRIVNGTDRAELIAGYAEEFETALKMIEPAEPTTCPLGRTDCPGASNAT